ncbi:hypothetical protein Q1695_008824 [Nippostrongylus brasiliensis]|nr:hypothetical protein Q1695_008824 [Nippostrongylus brasiliensis]
MYSQNAFEGDPSQKYHLISDIAYHQLAGIAYHQLLGEPLSNWTRLAPAALRLSSLMANATSQKVNIMQQSPIMTSRLPRSGRVTARSSPHRQVLIDP